MRRLALVRCGIATALLCLLCPAAAAREIEEIIAQLAEDQPTATRIAAARYLIVSKNRPDHVKAFPALTACLDSPDADLRDEAVRALGIAFGLKQPCPMGIVQALFDPDANVRLSAQTHLIFDKYPAAAKPLLLRALTSDDRNVRASATMALATEWGDDRTVLAALRKATKDEDPMVVNNAYAALWKATGDMRLVVRYWVESLDRWPPQDAEQLQLPELIALGAAHKLRDVAASQPAELAKRLVNLLLAKTALRRRNAARALGALGKENAEFKAAMKAGGAENRLRRLVNDADATVRAAAQAALAGESSLPPLLERPGEEISTTPAEP